MCDLLLNTNPDFQHHRIDYTTDNCDEVKHIPSIFEEVLCVIFVKLEFKRKNPLVSVEIWIKLIQKNTELLHLKSLICLPYIKWHVQAICANVTLIFIGDGQTNNLTALEHLIRAFDIN